MVHTAFHPQEGNLHQNNRGRRQLQQHLQSKKVQVLHNQSKRTCTRMMENLNIAANITDDVVAAFLQADIPSKRTGLPKH